MSIKGLDRLFGRFPELESRELVLRQIADGDVREVFAIFSDPNVTEFYDRHPLQDLDDAHTMIRSWQARFEEHQSIRWGIELRSESGLIGTCGFRLATG